MRFQASEEEPDNGLVKTVSSPIRLLLQLLLQLSGEADCRLCSLHRGHLLSRDTIRRGLYAYGISIYPIFLVHAPLPCLKPLASDIICLAQVIQGHQGQRDAPGLIPAIRILRDAEFCRELSLGKRFACSELFEPHSDARQGGLAYFLVSATSSPPYTANYNRPDTHSQAKNIPQG